MCMVYFMMFVVYIMKQASLLGVEAPTHSMSNTLCTCETCEWGRMWPQCMCAICMLCVVRWVSQ